MRGREARRAANRKTLANPEPATRDLPYSPYRCDSAHHELLDWNRSMTIGNVLAIAGLVFGFGFVVFFHELGHFLAAKWVGIKVEQFAVGFGHALLAFRKGLGWRVGSTTKEYEERVKQHLLEKGQ